MCLVRSLDAIESAGNDLEGASGQELCWHTPQHAPWLSPSDTCRPPGSGRRIMINGRLMKPLTVETRKMTQDSNLYT